MPLVLLSNNQVLHLDKSLIFAKGGESIVYLHPSDSSLLVKIYRRPSHQRADKLLLMLNNKPDYSEQQGHIAISWPIDLLLDSDQDDLAIGFLTQKIQHSHSSINFYSPKLRLKKFPLFNYLYLHRAAYNLAAILDLLHQSDYVVGDLNQSNILIDRSALVSLIDVDSFQLKDFKKIYRCPVGTPEFTPPELQGLNFQNVDRVPEHDLFGLGVFIFLLLMQGMHPFSGNVFNKNDESTTIEARIKNGYFIYSQKDMPYRLSELVLPAEIIDPPLFELFSACFEDGHHNPKVRPKPATWMRMLEKAITSLTVCENNPQHYFGKHLKNCPWCSRINNLGIPDLFPASDEIRKISNKTKSKITQISLSPIQPIEDSKGNLESRHSSGDRARRQSITDPQSIESAEKVYRESSSDNIFVLRMDIERFQAKLNASIRQSSKSFPRVFHVFGIGGVGKTTLLNRLIENEVGQMPYVKVSFGLTLGIETPLQLMLKLYENFDRQLKTSIWNRKLFAKTDRFIRKYLMYQQAINELENQPIEGEKKVTVEQVELVKKLTKFGTIAASSILPLGRTVSESIAEQVSTLTVDAAALFLSEKERLRELLRKHRVTKDKIDLQEFLLDPLSELTQAFVEDLFEKANGRPIFIIMDTYEKAPLDVDGWVCHYLSANMDLRKFNIFVLSAGRHGLLKTESWKKIQQDYRLVFERGLHQFNKQETCLYLEKIGITQQEHIQSIYQTTRGLPYYLNWIREQREQGKQLDFSHGKLEIVDLLLQGLDSDQALIVQMVSCCHWFDRSIVQYIISKSDCKLDFLTSENELDCFEWLKRRDFIKFAQYQYQLDDVARDIFRFSLWQENQRKFCQAHEILSNYFEARFKGQEEISHNSHAKDNVATAHFSEYIYHSLFCSPDGSQFKMLNDLLLNRSDTQFMDEVTNLVFAKVLAEEKIEEHPFLLPSIKEILLAIKIRYSIN